MQNSMVLLRIIGGGGGGVQNQVSVTGVKLETGFIVVVCDRICLDQAVLFPVQTGDVRRLLAGTLREKFSPYPLHSRTARDCFVQCAPVGKT